MNDAADAPTKSITVLDAVSVVVGIVIGAGIFRMPQFVAMNVASPAEFIGIWVVGGVIAFVGALCYAELAAAYPNTGGDYYFLLRGLGAGPAFLFAWARMTVIQPGAIALMGFVIGDYVAAAASLSEESTSANMVSSASAAVMVILLTAINMLGVREGKGAQKLLTALEVLGLLIVVVAGAVVLSRGNASSATASADNARAWGSALVFVMFTYSGWNEAAYLSGELRGTRTNILTVLASGLVYVAVAYLLVNMAYIWALGFAGVQESQAVAADTIRAAWGGASSIVFSIIVTFAALSTANATIFTGARSNYALGRDFQLFRFLGVWNAKANTPSNALTVQGIIALILVGFGAITKQGVIAMVEYTSPVFWLFLLLVGVSLFILRYKDPATERPFRVPLYPLLPLVFCGTCAYMLYATLAYTRMGALVGLGVLLAGVPLVLVARRTQEAKELGA